MAESVKRVGRLTLGFAWAATILLLPITSLPLLSRLAGNSMVAPASLIPLAWIVLFWTPFYIFKKGSLPRESIPLLLFISLAVISSALAFTLNTPSLKDKGILGEEMIAILSLLVGAGFYLVAAGWLSKYPAWLSSTFRLVDVGGALLLLWALVQGYYIYLFQSEYPALLVRIQSLFSVSRLFTGRMTAFAYEPSWLAQQLNLLFLPLWLAASVSGWSGFRFRLWKLSLENLLLAIGAAVLFVSSRVGALSFFLVLAFLGIFYNIRLAKRLQKWTLEHLTRTPALLKKSMHALLPGLLFLAFLGGYTLAAVVLVYGVSHVDARLARFFEITSITQLKKVTGNVYQFFNYLQFAERYVYWVAGWGTFNLQPLFGVGLGNAGFYFQQTLPAYGWTLPEVVVLYFRSPAILNIKSLWIRLLAETGMVGFSSFLAWCLVVLRSAWGIRSNQTQLFKMIGWFGLFVLIAFVCEGFSTDTFALPYVWLSLGIVSAAAATCRKQLSESTVGAVLDGQRREEGNQDAHI